LEFRWDQVTVIYLGDDVNDTDAFRMMRTPCAEESCVTLSVGVLHPDLMRQVC
jgi:trehalose-6-phosphatase